MMVSEFLFRIMVDADNRVSGSMRCNKFWHDKTKKSIATVSWNVVDLASPTTGLGAVFLYILHIEQFSKIFCILSFHCCLTMEFLYC